MNRVSNECVVTELETDTVEGSEQRVTFEAGDQAPLETAIESLFSGASGPSIESTADSRIDADERAALTSAEVDPESVADKEHSYRMLLDAGVDEGVAAALRRRFSLPWSFESDDDLDRRSSEVRGLGDAEREWIAKSGEEDWQTFEYDHTEQLAARNDGPDERPWSKPTPITAVTGVSADDAAVLAEAGIVSAERLATIDAATVANLLDFDVLHVRTWRYNARELVE
ncbi:MULTISPECIES: DUF7409 domain-containing protein [Natrialbaceae]|uniref:DUF7409 domain-containing protein n=1 Tax=Natrialbaceae TaxID=1644061 RepID=UPI00207CBD1B|nr:hypothetical protein [Natronococcus sp. CG52]